MELCNVKTVEENLIEKMVRQIEEASLLEGYDFSSKLRGIRDVVTLYNLVKIKDKEEDPFTLIEEKLEEIKPSSHCYLKYEVCLVDTHRTLWERDVCEIISTNNKAKKVEIELLKFDNKNKVHELSYFEVARPSCHTTIGGSHPLLALAGSERRAAAINENPVSKLKFRPEGETEFFNFRWFKNHLVSQNHLIEEGKFVRLRKDGVEHVFQYQTYLFNTEKLLFSEGDLVHSFSLKYFDSYEILEVF